MDITSRAVENHLAEGLTTSRVQSFGDNVFGFAATLLIFNLTIPADLLSENLQQLFVTIWPQALTYFLSFMVLGTLWIAHQNLFYLTKHLDRKAVWINILFLSFIALLPFSAAILRGYYAASIAPLFYGANLIVCGLSLYWFWMHAVKHSLLKEEVSRAMISVIKFRLIVPMVFTVCIMAVALVSPLVSLFMFVILFFLTTVPVGSDSIVSLIAHALHKQLAR